jgi:hypothetical protein
MNKSQFSNNRNHSSICRNGVRVELEDGEEDEFDDEDSSSSLLPTSSEILNQKFNCNQIFDILSYLIN